MSVGAKRLLPRGGTAIFCMGRFCVLAKSLQTGRLKHWKNVCRRKTPPAARRHRHFLRGEVLRIGKIASNGSFEALEKMSVGAKRLLPRGGTAIFCVGKVCAYGKIK